MLAARGHAAGERAVPGLPQHQVRHRVERRVDLWFACPDRIVDAGLLARYERLMSSEERARWHGLLFDRARRDFLVARALVRTVLAGYVGTGPGELVFGTNAFGRPELAWTERDGEPPRFSLSHTDGMVALAVTRCRAVGLDIENRRNRYSLASEESQFLSQKEQANLLGLSSGDRMDRSLELWTLKEAYAKAHGMGMALPFRAIAFEPHGEAGLAAHCEAEIGDEVGDEARRWRFFLMRHGAGHVLSLCVKRKHELEDELMARQVVPLVSEEPCRLSMLRNSS